jgi:transcriptional regulator with XRE-family HTH domain
MHGLTLKQLSAGCGLSSNAISLVERGKVAPTVATLCKIASALGVSASSFLQEICPTEVVLHRVQNADKAHPTERFVDNILGEDFLSPSTCYSDISPTGYVNQKVLCLCGQLELEDNDGQVYLLHHGDRLSCNGNAPQRWRNPGVETAIAILVFPAQHISNQDEEKE